MQNVHVFLYIVLLKQFVRVGLFFYNKFFWSSSFCVFENVTYDDVRFDKVRNGVEDAFGAVRLLLAPERKTFGKIFVTRYPKKKKGRKVASSPKEGREIRTSTCARHVGSQVEEPHKTESIVCSMLSSRWVLPAMP
jgi:hypothetical protein